MSEAIADKQEIIGRARKSGLYLLSQRVASGMIRLISSIALAGLLFPEAFGLMVLVNVFLHGLNLFSDTGIGPSVVRSKRGEDPAFYNTAWTVQVLRGVLLATLCVVLARPYAAIFGMPELVPLIMIGGLAPLAAGFRSPHWFTADRRQTIGGKVTIQLVSQVIGVGLMLLYVWKTGSVVGLVLGGVFQNVFNSLVSHFVLPGGRVRFRWEREAARELYNFGRWILISTAITFLAMQSDRLLLGVLLSPFWLGLYGIAIRLMSICTSFVQGLSSSVVFPTWMNSRRLDPEVHLRRMKRSRHALLCVAMAVLVAIAAGVPALFRMFYDDRYVGVIPLVQLLCLETWFATLTTTSTAAALVFGDSRATSRSNLVVFLTKAPLAALGFWAFGLIGFLMGTALSNLLGALVLGTALKEHGLHIRRDELDQSLLAILFLQLAIVPMLFGLPPVWQTLAEAAWGLALVLACLWPAREFLQTMLRR